MERKRLKESKQGLSKYYTIGIAVYLFEIVGLKGGERGTTYEGENRIERGETSVLSVIAVSLHRKSLREDPIFSKATKVLTLPPKQNDLQS